MPAPSRAPVRIAAILLGIVSGAIACGRGGDGPDAPRSPGAAAGGRPPNVLLLTVDTLRPDHLGCLGYARKTSPSIDSLARRGVIFRQTYTAAGRTVQSFPSILTGVYPYVHGLRHEGQDVNVLEGRLTLTRVLRDHGYDTFAVTQGLNVGLHRDFEMYDPDVYLAPDGSKVYRPSRDDRDASGKASAWLRSRRGSAKPFFLWMRYDAPHWPYTAPPPFGEKFDPTYQGPHTFNSGQKPDPRRGDLIFGLTRLPAREMEHAVAHYDGEVAFSDQAIGDLMATLDALGETARTIVVVTADHGEGLGEHDYYFEHGAYLYEPVVRVPFILAAPEGRLPEGRVVDAVTRTIDIMPTVIDLAGLPIPDGLQGRSLVKRARGEESGPVPPAYCESGRNYFKENPRQYIEGTAGKWRMLRDGRFKIILIPRDPEPVWEMYDLEADPGETTNIVARDPADAARLKEALLAIVADDPGRADRDATPVPDDLQDRLRSLGYVGGGGGSE